MAVPTPQDLAEQLRLLTAACQHAVAAGKWEQCHRLLQRRGALLVRMAQLSPEELVPAERDVLITALQETVADDAALRERLRAQQASIQRQLTWLAQAHRLADGYHRAMADVSHPVLLDQSI